MTDNLGVTPADLEKASTGINGVIDGLGQTGVGSGYSAGLGRGYGDLDLDGKTIGHADPKSGLEEYCDRWEWGVRALVTGAAEVSRGLGLGASHYEREEEWAANQLKDWTMDLIGDPNLTAEQSKDMSWSDLWDHNRNAVTNPQWALTPEEMQRHKEFFSATGATFLDDMGTIGKHAVNPVSSVTDTIGGFQENGFTADAPADPDPAVPNGNQ
ncbi:MULTISPECIES: hypothetical protein [Gordonia]|jgi:hypothetical protein|uniref:Uncharacterized protein n=2 Tax=Gordonia alkanivorans TaxID=84096 RepID=F9VWG9_9ACTN|nr:MULTISPECIES: hypothetical protein [Gordonia]ETA05572.1 hypothetical protein V525_19080 [Gordonia alkanivorans CGMCC 6845]MDH3009366.1 hypothetical protein [Gordonia alkanivorans]MDH3010086.1 hypothetical protein [Gordonia alkanivorans]MDH3014527.1 hypothetical protein [Gordonia alkanivorans]MDH3022567.1 hypothetical protein [Gordonia alkanivorans]